MKVKLLLILALLSSGSFATYTCSGEVFGVGIEPSSGYLFAQKIGPLEWAKLCSVSKDANGITADACKVIYSSLLTAQTSEKPVRLWFNDGKDCSKASHPSWYELKGWYFGPVIEG